MGGSVEPSAGRVVRPAPSFPQVVEVAQGVKVFLPAGWKGVHSFARREFYPWYNEVQFVVPGVAVAYPEDVILVGRKAGEGGPLEVVHETLFLLRGNPIFRPPGANPGAELPFTSLGVDQVAGHLRVAAQDFRRRLRAAGIVQPQQVIDRAAASALSVREHFYVHGPVPPMVLSVSRSWSRQRMTSIASAWFLWVLAQRAS